MTTPRRLIIGLLVLAALILVPEARAAIPLEDVASTLVGYSVTVECFPPDGIIGGWVVLTEPTVIHLDGELCGALNNVLQPGPRTAQWLRTAPGYQMVGSAIQILTHEAMHLRLLSADEGHVECVAVRNVWQSVRLLPLVPQIRKLVYIAAVQTHSGIGIPAYRTEC